MVTMTTIGERVKRYRVAFGYTQSELARRAGVLQPVISSLETGRHYPRFDTVRKLAHALGIPISALVDDAISGPPEPPSTPRTDERDEVFAERFGKLSVVEAGELRAELDAELSELQSYIRSLKAANVGDEEFTLKRARAKLARCVRRLSAATLLETEASLGREPKSFEEYASVPDELETWLREMERADRLPFNGGVEAG